MNNMGFGHSGYVPGNCSFTFTENNFSFWWKVKDGTKKGQIGLQICKGAYI